MPLTDGKEQFLGDVFPAELREINKRRRRLDLAETSGKLTPATDHNLVGLALSGGGLRSATFSLGVIQALANHGLLKAVDYMSTVSGGGFLGTCISSLLNDKNASTQSERFPLRYQVGNREPLAVGQLRQGARYLAPGGALDRLRIPALILRGVVGNLLIFLFLILLLVLATEFVYEVGSRTQLRFGSVALGGLGVFLFLVIAFPLSRRLLGRQSNWRRRNLEEMVFTTLLISLLMIILFTVIFIFVDQWLDSSWLDTKSSITSNLLRPFEPRDYLQWLVILLMFVMFMLVGRVSTYLGRAGGRLALFALGFLGPVSLATIYLVLLPMQVDSPFVTAGSLFSLDESFGYVLDDMDQVSSELRDEFRSNQIRLGNAAQVTTLETDLRWLVHDGDRAYILLREQGRMVAYPDYQYLLNRGVIPSDFNSILAKKGLRLGPESAPVVEADNNRFTISGSHVYWIEHDPGRDTWTLEQLVASPVLADTLQKISYTLQIAESPADILLHEKASLSEDDLAQAIRFAEQVNPHDVVILIDNSVPPFQDREAFTRAFEEAITRAFKSIRSSVRMAIFWFDEHVHEAGTLKSLTAQRKEVLLGRLFGDRDDAEPLLDFQGSGANVPAALERAMRELRERSPDGVRKSIVLISDGNIEPTAMGLDNPLQDWMKNDFVLDAKSLGARLHGIALSKDARFDLFAKLTRGTGGIFYPVFESTRGEAFGDLFEALNKIKEAAGSHLVSPFEHIVVTDRESDITYTLTRSKRSIKLTAAFANPGLSVEDVGDKEDWWRTLFRESGVELSDGASITRAGDRRWKLLDPYSYTLSRNGRRLMVVETMPPGYEGSSGLFGTSIPSSLWDGRTDWVFLGVLAILFVYWLTVDINLTATHSFYRDRLSKAYLFRLTGSGALQHDDKQLLSGLNTEGSVAPYHLINVALNLQGSRDPGLRGRVSDFFIFSKHFTGSERTGYLGTREMERYDRNLDLGTAMAISAAAAAPNAGVSTIKPLVFVMALLNLRLGYWLPNPGVVTNASWITRLSLWRGPGPKYVLKESLGQLDSTGTYINLSDGGHIENLAIFELLRRRCRFIIAIDGERDGGMKFDGLVKLMVYARIDLGVLIDIDLEPLRRNEQGLSARHWVLGTIRYADGEIGSLLYIKPSLTGGEYEYIRKYRSEYPSFPHESTAIQFFTEAQFEAYRGLGYHIGDQIFSDADALADLRHFEVSGR